MMTALFAAAVSAQTMRAGKVFVHTARNSPIFYIKGAQTPIKAGTLVDAEGLRVKCGPNQCAMLVFSNRTVVFMRENSSLSVDSFMQMMPFDFDFKDDFESTRSDLAITLGNGEFYVLSPAQRPTSTMKFKSEYGTFQPQSREFELEVSENGARIAILDGQSAFTALDGKPDFLQAKQTGKIMKSESKGMYPLRIDYLSMIESETCEKTIALCKFPFNSVRFFFDKKGGLSAERVVQKEFLSRRTKYDFKR